MIVTEGKNIGASLLPTQIRSFHRGSEIILAIFSILILLGAIDTARAQQPGTFYAGTLAPTNTLGNYVSVKADFNNDGKLDVLSNVTDVGFAVQLGNGDGTFQPPIVTRFPNMTYVRAEAVGDFNNDGAPDVVAVAECFTVACGYSQVGIFLGHDDGTFTLTGVSPVEGYVSGIVPTVAVGDFDGNGWQDVVATTGCYVGSGASPCSAGAVLIFPGKGDGTLGTPQMEPAPGNGALPVVVAYINHDQRPDIVAVSSAGPNSSLIVLLNTGGGFTESTVALPYYAVNHIVAADFDSDGYMDLATTDTYSGTEVLFGNGDGTFKLPPVEYRTGIYSYTGLATADMNGDGKPDLITGSSEYDNQSEADILLNDGTGKFNMTSYPLGGRNQGSTIAGDFNGDGYKDVLVVSSLDGFSGEGGARDGTLGLLLGNGDGTMRAANIIPLPVGAVPHAVLAANLNGDGISDLIEINSTQNAFVILGTGNGHFGTPSTVPLGAAGEARAGVTGDFNGDGKVDLAVVSTCADNSCTQGGVTVLLGNGDGTFQSPVTYGAGALYSEHLAAGDVNGDGKLDLIAESQCAAQGCSPGEAVSVLLGNGDGTFQSAQVTPTIMEGGHGSVVVGDFNGDGRTDVAAGGYVYNGRLGSEVEIFLANSGGSLIPSGSYLANGAGDSNSMVSLAVGDINGDGNQDIVAANVCDGGTDVICGSGSVGILLGNGSGGFGYGAGMTTPDANFASADLDDVNADGKLDLIASTGSGTYVALGKGNGTFQPATVYAGPGNLAGSWLTIAVADINGDGLKDIVTPGYFGRNLDMAILLNGAGAPRASISQSSFDFGNLPTGTESASQQVTVTNTGTAGLVFDAGAVTLNGADPGDFAIVSDGCSGQAIGWTVPNNSCSVSVAFWPQAAGSETATLDFADNASGSPQSVALSGTGLTPQQVTQNIINQVNALSSQGVINNGQDNSLVKELQKAIDMMNAGKISGAIANLEDFISEVNDLSSSGILSPTQAGALVSAVNGVIAQLQSN